MMQMKYCPGCMKELLNSSEACPFCGFYLPVYKHHSRWLPIGYVLNGKYILGKVIGEGGFGIIYIAWDLNLQVRVAVKEYFPIDLAVREGRGVSPFSIIALTKDQEEDYLNGMNNFMTEAKNLSQYYGLEGIVSVKDFFFENSSAYMVMEFIDGITLKEYLHENGTCMEEQEVLKMMRPVIDSLQIVHQSGVVHRDISPDNIMITKDYRLKLIDFGAAQFAGEKMKNSYTIILKHGYAPAEQYQSQGNGGAWTDIYAISATIYYMLTGVTPPDAMDRLHMDTLKSFKDIGCRISKRTTYAILKKGMALAAEKRYQSMDELISVLYGRENLNYRKRNFFMNHKITSCAIVVGLLIIMILQSPRFENGKDVVRIAETGSEKKEPLTESDVEENTEKNVQNLQEKNSNQLETNNENEYETEKKKQEKVVLSDEEWKALSEAADKESKTISANGFSIAIVQPDGSVIGKGLDTYGETKLENWENVAEVSVGMDFTIGLKKDGTVIAAGNESEGKCAVSRWRNVQQVAAGESHTLGLLSDGSVVAAGENKFGCCNVYMWSDITAVAVGKGHSLGINKDGTIAAAGDNSMMQCQVENWSEIVKIVAKGNTSAGLRKDGTVVVTGEDAKVLRDVGEWEQVIDITLGEHYIAGIFADGHVEAVGEQRFGNIEQWKDICAIAAGEETLFGKNKNGEIIRTNDLYGVAERKEFNGLKKVAYGNNVLTGLKKDGTIAIWGAIGYTESTEKLEKWNKITDIAATEKIIAGLKEDGTVLVSDDGYEKALSWKNVVQIAACQEILLGEQSDGTLLVDCGNLQIKEEDLLKEIHEMKENAEIQNLRMLLSAVMEEHFAVLNEDGTVKTEREESLYIGANIVQIEIGKEHIVGLCSDGTVTATGTNNNGQCNVDNWKNVISIATGPYQTFGICEDGTLLIAGTMPGEY